MYQFFVADSQIGREFITITGADVNHIKNALRMKPGEKIRISNQNGTDYFCEITEITDSFVQAGSPGGYIVRRRPLNRASQQNLFVSGDT